MKNMHLTPQQRRDLYHLRKLRDELAASLERINNRLAALVTKIRAANTEQ